MKLKDLMIAAAMTFAIFTRVEAAEPLEKADEIPGTFSAKAAITSEYYFRVLTQTDDAPALQGGFDYEIGLGKNVMGYLGIWGSNVDFNEGAGIDGATVEMDFYGGLKGEFGQPDYTEWALGGTVNLAGFDLNLTYTDTNIAGDPDGATEVVLFTVSRSF